MPKDNSTAVTTTSSDIDRFMDNIKAMTITYRNNVDKLKAIKGQKKRAGEQLDLLAQRKQILDSYLQKKDATKKLITYLEKLNPGLAALKEREFKEVLTAFKDINQEFRELNMMQDRSDLLEGAKPKSHGDDPTRMTNDQLLDKALEMQSNTKSQLQDGLRMLTEAHRTGLETMGTLQQDREKMSRINAGLDEVESELAISQKLITNVVKRAMTDKVIIALTFLILCGVVGIIVYATLNPNQKIFSVPDAIKPDIPGVTSPTPSPRPSPS